MARTTTPRLKQKSSLFGKPNQHRLSQKGVALLIVTTMTALIAALAANFAYSARIYLVVSLNQRDQLRAEYEGARSAIAVGQLLMQVQTEIQQSAGKSLPMLESLDLTNQAPLFLSLLQTTKAGNASSVQADLKIRYEDGSYPIQCAGGLNPDPEQQKNAYAVLSALFSRNPFPKGNPLFDEFNQTLNRAGRDGTAVSAMDIPRWIIDWIDLDERRFDRSQLGTAPEEKYERDPYRYQMHNHYMDTLQEGRLIRGIETDQMARLLEASVTVYGRPGCKASMAGLSMESWPLMAAILAAASSEPASLLDPNTEQVAKQLIPFLKNSWSMLKNQTLDQLLKNMGLDEPNKTSFCPTDPKICPGNEKNVSQATQNIAQLLCSPLVTKLPDLAKTGTLLNGPGAVPAPITALHPIALCPALLERYINAPQGGIQHPIYTLQASGHTERPGGNKSEIRIRATWDMQRLNSNPICSLNRCNRGTWLYFRVN